MRDFIASKPVPDMLAKAQGLARNGQPKKIAHLPPALSP
jgi:hypothetical protein